MEVAAQRSYFKKAVSSPFYWCPRSLGGRYFSHFVHEDAEHRRRLAVSPRTQRRSWAEVGAVRLV